MLDALKKYGMIVADNGSNWFISGAADTRWNDNDLNQLKTVPGSAFEVVEHGRVAAQVARTRTYSRPVRFSTRPDPEPVGPGQESAWDYPRPPRARAGARSAHGRARRRDHRRHDAWVPGARDQPPAQLLLPARRRRAGRADARRRRFVLRVEGPRALLHRARRRTRRGRRPRGRTPRRAPRSPPSPTTSRSTPAAWTRASSTASSSSPQPGGFYGGWITADRRRPVQGRARLPRLVAPTPPEHLGVDRAHVDANSEMFGRAASRST